MIERTLLFTNKAMIPFSIGLAIVLGALILYLYRAERSMVRPAAGRILTGLRIALVAVLLVMLTEPIISVTMTETRNGTLVVMVDNSRSMQVGDADRPAWERLRLADALGLLGEGVHRSGLRVSEESLGRVLTDAEAASKRWGEFAEVMALNVLGDKERAERVNESLEAVLALRKNLAVLVAGLSSSSSRAEFPGEVSVAVEKLRSRLGEMTGLLDEMSRELSNGEFQARPTVGRLRGINQSFARLTAQLGQSLGTLRETVVQHDTAIAAGALSASPEAAKVVDSGTRLGLAGRMLTDPRVNFIARLSDHYRVQTWAFARRAGETPLSSADNGFILPVSPAMPAADGLYSDLSDSLQRALQGSETQEVAGIVVLSDGRFNHGEDAARAARALGSRGIPVTTVLVGSEKPPRDIAVVKVAAVDFVHDKDAVDVSVLVKAEGFEGQELALSVREKGQAVVEKKFTVPPSGRATVNFSFVPEGKGQHNYVVDVPVQPREVFTNNNEKPFAVSVIDKKLKVLLVDGGPRWEYRYLKNALSRDKRLDFKCLLFDPLTASKEEAQRAVDAFPHKRDELFAFDTLIFGDVDPAKFTAEDLTNLEAFVIDRGGTMIVVAGKEHMPADYAKTAFARVLPIVPGAADSAEPMPADGLPLKLTAEARQSPIFRLVPDERENVEAWTALPRILWCAPAAGVKPGAVVWSYASFSGGETTDEAAKHPVVLSQACGLGRVFYVGTDETWRWRYKVADKYLYQFWGQVILWATSGKLPVGTERVRLGTDKFEYVDGEDVVVRARILSDKAVPVADAMVSARLVRKTDDVQVAEAHLDYLADSGGHYEGRFPNIGTGAYAVKLNVAGLEQESASVVTDVEVKEAPTRELIDLGADAATMEDIAAKSGGRAFRLDDLARVPDSLKPLTWKHVTTEEITLWSSAWLLVAFCIIVTAEWVIRKVEGLL